MSAEPAVESSSKAQASEGQKTALVRLAELKRDLQRLLRRKPTRYERTALDRAALMMLRAEMAASDPKATSNDIVRLDNAARRARLDFERVADIKPLKRKQATMADLERELSHAR